MKGRNEGRGKENRTHIVVLYDERVSERTYMEHIRMRSCSLEKKKIMKKKKKKRPLAFTWPAPVAVAVDDENSLCL